VRQTPGAVGYVELGYAMINKLPAGAVRNKAGKFITPALESVTAAAAGAMTAMDPNTDFRVSITNPDGDKAYPIASFTWFLIHKQYDDPAKAGALVKFVWWAETDGQSRPSELGYAALPNQLRPWIEARLKTITAGGKSVWKTTAARRPALGSPPPGVVRRRGCFSAQRAPLQPRDGRGIAFRAYDDVAHRTRACRTRGRAPHAGAPSPADAFGGEHRRPALPGRPDGPGAHAAAVALDPARRARGERVARDQAVRAFLPLDLRVGSCGRGIRRRADDFRNAG